MIYYLLSEGKARQGGQVSRIPSHSLGTSTLESINGRYQFIKEVKLITHGAPILRFRFYIARIKIA